jgi:hypothetical protein
MDERENPFFEIIFGKKDYNENFLRLKKMKTLYKGKTISVAMDFHDKAFIKLQP